MEKLFHNQWGIPYDVMFIILSSIEAADIFGMRFVSKNWHVSINDKEFIKEHNKISKARRARHIMSCKIVPGYNSFKIMFTISKKYIVEEEWCHLAPHPEFGPFHKFDFVGSIDGILCLHYASDNNVRLFYLFNPATGQHMIINSHIMIPWHCKFL